MSHPSWITGIAVLLAALGGSASADEPPKLDGRWKVVSVELAGMSVPGLEVAELVLTGGKKVFTLPDGRVEKGTYRLQAGKQPREIDATTEGREGTEPGIYAVEGDTLKLCLATRGGPRPREFATKQGSDHILIVLRRAAEKPADASPASRTAGKRAFRMGFTGFVYDITLEAVTASRKFVRENGDILAHHIEGVPWAECLADRPFPKALLDEWQGKKSATPPGGKVYLAISPGRGDLKVAEKAAPLPAELKGKPYDDPLVMKTYLAYCRRAIVYFKPDYLAIGIETNEIHDLGPRTWRAYVALHQHVYAELKKDHPGLPICASCTLHNLFKKRGAMLAEWKKLMPHNDLVAVSYYPFFVPDKDRLAALDWMIEQFDAFGKPFAMVETNDAAERLPLPMAKVVIEGTPEKQEAYYRKLLGLAQQRGFVFVISFIHQDYDALWEKIKQHSPELFIAWRDCGLLDERGKARPAYHVWKDFFALPLHP
jgi:uncharacterized protein (TIGR03067 family)